jgi:hypothetical protein
MQLFRSFDDMKIVDDLYLVMFNGILMMFKFFTQPIYKEHSAPINFFIF